MKPTPDEIRSHVRTAYDQAVKTSDGGGCGCAPGCCSPQPTGSTLLGYDAAELASLPVGADLGLGCGNPLAIASLKPGEVVLDLGSGPGMDALLAAKRVGPTGKVIGVDMTPSMLTRARENAAKAGLSQVEFRLGEIEALPVADGAVDVIISNCVVNLSPEKSKVLAEMARVLKAGGRIAISDVISTAPISEAVRQDLNLHAGCISGAMSREEWTRGLADAGFTDVTLVLEESSRAMIDQWAPPGLLRGEFVSARIGAVKGVRS